MITLQPEVLRPYVRVASRHSVEKGEHWKRTLYDFQLILVKQGRIILHQNGHLFKILWQFHVPLNQVTCKQKNKIFSEPFTK